MTTAKYRQYLNCVKRATYPLKCPRCDFISKPSDIQIHLQTHRTLKRRNACTWCWGVYSWRMNETSSHVDHIRPCYETFVKEYLTIDTRFRRTLSHYEAHQKQFWTETVEKCPILVKCPKCPTSMQPRDLETHYETVHKLKTKKVCVFCDGRYQGKDAHHLRQCFERLITPQKSTAITGIMDRTPQCPARDMLGRSKLNHEEIFYADFYKLEYDSEKDDVHEDDNQLEFLDNVGSARFFLRRYLLHEGDQWYHVMVRLHVMSDFYHVVSENRSTTFLLPFWCLCDGGGGHHRHMILVTRDSEFMKRQWKKIVDKQKCKLSKPVKTFWHLVQTINYVSKRESKCTFSLEATEKRCHYYIARELPKCAKLCMATCSEDGFQNYLTRRFGHVSSLTLMKEAVRGSEWQIPSVSSLFSEEEKRIVLPVGNGWKPQMEESPHFMWLLNGRKLYFVKGEEEVSVQQQVEGGNVLYKLMDGAWTLPPSKQKELNMLSEMKREMENVNEMHRRREAKLERDLEEARRYCERNLVRENSRLQEELDRMREKGEREMKVKEHEICNLREELKLAKSVEVKRLLEELDRMREKEKHWEYEICNLREELKLAKSVEVKRLLEELDRMREKWEHEICNLREELKLAK